MNKYLIKKQFFKLTGVLERRWNSIGPGLFVFNYHRVGDSDSSPFDPNVFSCDVDHFVDQVQAIKERFRIIDIATLKKYISSGEPLTESLAMITFDDGYRDNYLNAFPELQKLAIPATFFVPTHFIENTIVPWWDEIAWMIKNTDRKKLHIRQWHCSLEINPRDYKNSIRKVLSAFKAMNELNIESKLEHLREATGYTMPVQDGADLFMRWDDINTLLAQGMDIGSHTHSHQILSHLEPEEQRNELLSSKALIEAKTGVTVEALAYPVGGHNSYDTTTMEIASSCGYSLAFNTVNGYNQNPARNPFEIHRIMVANSFPEDIKMAAIQAPPYG